MRSFVLALTLLGCAGPTEQQTSVRSSDSDRPAETVNVSVGAEDSGDGLSLTSIVAANISGAVICTGEKFPAADGVFKVFADSKNCKVRVESFSIGADSYALDGDYSSLEAGGTAKFVSGDRAYMVRITSQIPAIISKPLVAKFQIYEAVRGANVITSIISQTDGGVTITGSSAPKYVVGSSVIRGAAHAIELKCSVPLTGSTLADAACAGDPVADLLMGFVTKTSQPLTDTETLLLAANELSAKNAVVVPAAKKTGNGGVTLTLPAAKDGSARLLVLANKSSSSFVSFDFLGSGTSSDPKSICVVEAGSYGSAEERIKGLNLGYVVKIIKPDGALDDCKTLVLSSSFAEGANYPPVKASMPKYGDYVKRGGSLLMFQPNPYEQPGEKIEISIAGTSFTVENRYTDLGVKFLNRDHPITAGLSGFELPFPADRATAFSAQWEALAAGLQSGHASLLAADLACGRMVLDNEHPACPGRTCSGNSSSHSDKMLTQTFNWLWLSKSGC